MRIATPSIASLRLPVIAATLALAAVLLLLPPPAGLSPQAWKVAIVALAMAVWWLAEVLPLSVTALVPLIAFPLLGVSPIEDVATAYAHPLIFLFLGGFIIARAMERWGLHRRIALQIVRFAGDRPSQVVAGLMAATAFLSLWISNTATAMVMLPIGSSIAVSAGEGRRDDFGTALMLGIGYAATIGGMGSLIGTPPNALFAGFMKETYGIEIGFAQWMLLGLPLVAVLLPVTWWLLTRAVFEVADRDGGGLAGNVGKPAPMSSAEMRVAIVMVAVAALWILRPLIARLLPGVHLTDAGIAVLGATLLFVLPSGAARSEPLIRWDDAARIRWDILILFGGGLALADAISASGLAGWIGEASVAWGHLPPLLLVALVTVIVVYLGELASNTAMAAVFLPIAGAVAVGIGAAPIDLALPIALAASLGFMLPVATPPNAIVFGSGAVTVQQMLRAGALLDVIGIAVVIVIGTLLGPLVFPAG